MESHASVYQFEEANEVKSKIKHLQKFQYKSTVVDTNITSLGVMNFTKDSKYAYINALLVMQGTIIKSKTTVVQTAMGESDERVLSHALGNNLIDFFNYYCNNDKSKNIINNIIKNYNLSHLIKKSHKNNANKNIRWTI